MTIDELSLIARNKKEAFLQARSIMADFDTMTRLANEYTDAIAEWHKVRFPKKKLNKPSVGYLIRAL